MRLFRVKSKLEKTNRFKVLFEESLLELTGEVKKACGGTTSTPNSRL